MSQNSVAFVPTPNARRYLEQLCKHWSHNLEKEFAKTRGTVVFPADARGANHPGDATLTLSARDIWLQLEIDASCQDQLDQLREVVERHLERFAFREPALPFHWQ